MKLFFRVAVFGLGFLSFLIGVSILLSIAKLPDPPEWAYHVSGLVLFSSVGFLVAERKTDELEDAEMELSCVNLDRKHAVIVLDDYRHLIMKKIEENDELKKEIVFLREKYHNDIEVMKDA